MIAILLALLAAASAPAGAPSSPPTSVARGRLVAFGHSWVAGRYPDPGVRPWPDRVADARHVRLDNRAVGGTEAAQTAEAVDDYQPRRGDEVVVEAMLNDVRRHGSAGIPSFRTRMRAILRHLTAGPVRPARVVVAIDAPIAAWAAEPPYDRGSDAILARYGKALRRVVDRLGRRRVRVVDLGRGWRTARHIGPDGIHPNEAGTQRLADRIDRALAAVRISRAGR